MFLFAENRWVKFGAEGPSGDIGEKRDDDEALQAHLDSVEDLANPNAAEEADALEAQVQEAAASAKKDLEINLSQISDASSRAEALKEVDVTVEGTDLDASTLQIMEDVLGGHLSDLDDALTNNESEIQDATKAAEKAVSQLGEDLTADLQPILDAYDTEAAEVTGELQSLHDNIDERFGENLNDEERAALEVILIEAKGIISAGGELSATDALTTALGEGRAAIERKDSGADFNKVRLAVIVLVWELRGEPNKATQAEAQLNSMSPTDEAEDDFDDDFDDEIDAQEELSEEPTEQPEEPTEQPEEPTEQPEEPTEQPEEPTEQPEEPTEQPEEPTEQPEEPTEQPEEPTEQPEEPTEQAEAPVEAAPFEGLTLPESGLFADGNSELQAALTGLGFEGSNPDQNIRDIQKAYGLSVDGAAGPKTTQLMNTLMEIQHLGGEIPATEPLHIPDGQTIFADNDEAIQGHLQNMLPEGQYNEANPDANIRAFQRLHGLNDDGAVGPLTMTIMNNELTLENLRAAAQEGQGEEPDETEPPTAEEPTEEPDEATGPSPEVVETPIEGGPEMTYGEGVTGMLDAYGFTDGKLSFRAEMEGPGKPKIRLNTGEIPDGTKFALLEDGAGRDAEKALDHVNFANFRSISISVEGDNKLRVESVRNSGLKRVDFITFPALETEGEEGEAISGEDGEMVPLEEHGGGGPEAQAESARKNIENIKEGAVDELIAYFKENFPGAVIDKSSVYLGEATTDKLTEYGHELSSDKHGAIVHFTFSLGGDVHTFNYLSISRPNGQEANNANQALKGALQEAESFVSGKHEDLVEANYESPGPYQEGFAQWKEVHEVDSFGLVPGEIELRTALEENSDDIHGVESLNIIEEGNQVTVQVVLTMANGKPSETIEVSASGKGKSAEQLLEKALQKLAKQIKKQESGALASTEEQDAQLTAHAEANDKTNFNLDERLAEKATELQATIDADPDASEAEAYLKGVTMESIRSNLDSGSGSCTFDYCHLVGGEVQVHQVSLENGAITVHPSHPNFQDVAILVGGAKEIGPFDKQATTFAVEEGGEGNTLKGTEVVFTPSTLANIAEAMVAGDLPSQGGRQLEEGRIINDSGFDDSDHYNIYFQVADQSATEDPTGSREG